MAGGMTLTQAREVIAEMAARWDETPCWHDPPFHDGRIHVTTKELHAASVLMRELTGLDAPATPEVP